MQRIIRTPSVGRLSAAWKEIRRSGGKEEVAVDSEEGPAAVSFRNREAVIRLRPLSLGLEWGISVTRGA